MIPVVCQTKFSDYNCYVTNIACAPKIGDKVAVMYKGDKRSLYIVQIIHSELVVNKPHLVIELDKHNPAFYR